MSTSTAALPSARAALSALVDYAGIFPPAQLPMDAAAAEYASERRGPYAWMLGRFIVPLSRADDLLEAAAATAAPPFALSAIVDAGSDPRTWFSSAEAALRRCAAYREQGAAVEVLEVPLPPLASRRETYEAPVGQLGALIERAGLRSLPAFVELRRDERWRDELDLAMRALARARLGAKLRCGGTEAGAFPSIDDVTAFVAAAAAAGVPFKATAGLHHPLRHTDPATGWPMHGFLNLLAAAAAAGEEPAGVVAAIVAEEEPAAFAFDESGLRWRDLRFDVARIARTRCERFVSYGSCSFGEPVDDLVGLGVLGRAS